MRNRITILQKQHSSIVLEAGEILEGSHKQLADMVKNETENRLTLLNYREAIMKFQDDLIPWK